MTLERFRQQVSGVNNAVYKVFDSNTEITDDSTMIVPGMKIFVTAEDSMTTAEYTVINSNLCLNKPVTVSSYETGNTGSNAVDGDISTRWTAVNGTTHSLSLSI